jgi:hypothetical protein
MTNGIVGAVGSAGFSAASNGVVGPQGPVILGLQTFVGQGAMAGKLVIADGTDVVSAVAKNQQGQAKTLVTAYFAAQKKAPPPVTTAPVDTYMPSAQSAPANGASTYTANGTTNGAAATTNATATTVKKSGPGRVATPNAVPAGGSSTWTQAQIQAMTSADIASLTVAQIQGLSTTQMTWFLAGQIPSFSATALGAMSAAQLQALSTTQIAALLPAQIAALTTAQIPALTTTQVSSFTTDQMGATPPWRGSRRPTSA